MQSITPDMLTVSKYKELGNLPDPFLFNSGNRVSSPKEWCARRKELYQSAVTLQFGDFPLKPEIVEIEELCRGKNQRSYKLHIETKNGAFSLNLKAFLPNAVNRPIIINGDLCSGYCFQEGFIDIALKNDIGWILFDRTELAHDVISENVKSGALYGAYPNLDFGTIAAWAWGYILCVDALYQLKLPQVDLSYIAVTGHSRGGKSAILAGAVDERIAIVNPNEACLGGGGCYRISYTGHYLDLPPWNTESLSDIIKTNPFWLGPKMKQYVGKEEKLPFDTHFLKAMIAPRVLLVSEAAGDIWANPIGSWQTTIAAKEVFDFLDAGDNLHWYYRAGTHYHKAQDIKMLINVILHHFDNTTLCTEYERLPFADRKKIFDWVAPNKTKLEDQYV